MDRASSLLSLFHEPKEFEGRKGFDLIFFKSFDEVTKFLSPKCE